MTLRWAVCLGDPAMMVRRCPLRVVSGRLFPPGSLAMVAGHTVLVDSDGLGQKSQHGGSLVHDIGIHPDLAGDFVVGR